jgi:hypothetical protein
LLVLKPSWRHKCFPIPGKPVSPPCFLPPPGRITVIGVDNLLPESTLPNHRAIILSYLHVATSSLPFYELLLLAKPVVRCIDPQMFVK